MRKRTYTILLLLIIITIPTTTRATDLPIDINAIGRQDNTTQRFGTHFSTDLFTEDSVRVNEMLAAHTLRRQETYIYLFNTISFEYEINIHEHITSTANSLVLFSTPTDFSHINIPAQEEPLPMWVFVIAITVCAMVGFALAMIRRSKKKRQAIDVY